MLGALIGQLIPFSAEGIDFAMTALFIVICTDHWKASKTHIPAVIGFVCAIVFLALIRSSGFILPALAATTAVLLFLRSPIEAYMEES